VSSKSRAHCTPDGPRLAQEIDRSSRRSLTQAFNRAYKETVMLLTIAIILFILWALGFFAFHVAGGLIHLLLVIAVIVIIVHLIQGRRPL
jgi:Family of unknown function (DUF5670)